MIDDLNDIREQAHRIPGFEAILDRISSNIQGLEIDVLKDRQGGLCIYSILNKEKRRKKGCKDSCEPQIKRVLWTMIRIFCVIWYYIQTWQGSEQIAIIIKFMV